jgi:hypothetical protein
MPYYYFFCVLYTDENSILFDEELEKSEQREEHLVMKSERREQKGKRNK